MTKKRMAQAFIQLFSIMENDHIAFGDDSRTAIINTCLDAGITQSEYKAICRELNK